MQRPSSQPDALFWTRSPVPSYPPFPPLDIGLTKCYSAVALNALRQKKVYESELDKLAGRRLTIETQVGAAQRREVQVIPATDAPAFQVNAIESANMNLETMVAMKQGANVLKSIHGNLCASYAIHQRGRSSVLTQSVARPIVIFAQKH